MSTYPQMVPYLFYEDTPAALEFLKRRCPQDWSDRVEIHSRRQAAELRAELSADEQKALAMALLVD